jgi:hypothetical protein
MIVQSKKHSCECTILTKCVNCKNTQEFKQRIKEIFNEK